MRQEGAERLLAARADPTLKNTRGNSALTIWNHAHDAVTWSLGPVFAKPFNRGERRFFLTAG